MNHANPALTGYAEAQDAVLKIHLDIGAYVQEKRGGTPIVSGNRLGVDGMFVELRGSEDADYKHPNLPGAQGPNPQLSSGAKALQLLKKGQYVDLTGSHRVTMDNGAWEIIWRKGASAGALVCGFEVPKEVKRNDVSIPKGRVYVTFPLWTSESLQDLRKRKAKAEERATEALDRLKEAGRKMEAESNPLKKALYFRDACKAHEEIDYSGHRLYSAMPLDKDMIKMKEGLHLCSLGTVWTKTGGFLGGDQVLLGSAKVSKSDVEELVEKQVVSERELKPVAFDGLRPFE